MESRRSQKYVRRSPILARYNEDTYAIGRLILDRTRALGLSRTELVRRLGYSSLAGGHKVLTAILRTGIVPRTTTIARHLAAALEVEDSFLVSVIEASEWQRRDENRAQVLARESAYRATFKPYLRTETARTRPEPLFIAALFTTARLRHVSLPDEVWHLNDEQRDSASNVQFWSTTARKMGEFRHSVRS